jgi:hypothetical protein
VQEKDRKRFMDKVNVNPETGCWEWTASTSSGGYGMFALSRTQFMAHRVSYELHIGLIPEGLTLDHTCHDPKVCHPEDHNACPHRRCVNPEHLEPITMKENARRGRTFQAENLAKTECPSGHPYDEENTKWYQGRRYCRACHKVHSREWARRKSAEAARLKAA